MCLKGCFAIGALVVASFVTVTRADEAVNASGKQIAPQDLKDAKPVATFTPKEFMQASDQWTQQQCRKGTVNALSDGSKIFLEGSAFSDDEFATELALRNKEHPVYCVEILGPGSDPKRVAALLRKLKGTPVESISWRLPK